MAHPYLWNDLIVPAWQGIQAWGQAFDAAHPNGALWIGGLWTVVVLFCGIDSMHARACHQREEILAELRRIR